MINVLLKNKKGQSQTWDYIDLMFTFLILIFIFFFVGFLIDSEKGGIQQRINAVSNSIRQTDLLLVNFKFEGGFLSRDIISKNDGSNPYIPNNFEFSSFTTGVPGESTFVSTEVDESPCYLECKLEELLLDLNPNYKNKGNHFIVEYPGDEKPLIIGNKGACGEVCSVDEIYLPSFEKGIVNVTYVVCDKSVFGSLMVFHSACDIESGVWWE